MRCTDRRERAARGEFRVAEQEFAIDERGKLLRSGGNEIE